jgi:excisionase family DNA binding protein
VAALLKINEKTDYWLTADGKIPGFRVSDSRRFRRSDIDRWIEAQQAATKAK